MIEIGTPSSLNIKSEKVVEFYKREWRRPIALGNIEFYTWQFKKLPGEENIDNCCIAIDEEKKILGVMGLNNRKFYLEEEELEGAELTTWVVSPKSRGQGVGPKMIKFLLKKYSILIGMGISEAALPIYLKSGFKYLKSIPRYVKVIDWSQLTTDAEYTITAKKIDTYYNKKSISNDYKILEFNKENISLLNKNFVRNNNLFSREYEYLKWRYVQHPTFDYRLHIIKSIKNNGDGALVVTRVETASNGLKILHITDLFGDIKDIECAIEFVEKIAKEDKVPVIDFFTTNSKINSFFIKKGWFSALDNDYFKFPHLFQPLELRNPTTTSLIYWSKTDNIDFYDIGKLYITKQDADFDRPVLKKG